MPAIRGLPTSVSTKQCISASVQNHFKLKQHEQDARPGMLGSTGEINIPITGHVTTHSSLAWPKFQ